MVWPPPSYTREPGRGAGTTPRRRADAYREGMSPRPLLVLLHGTRFDASEWDGYAELIPEADVVCVDLPGHGSRAGQEWTADGVAEATDEAIREIADGRPVILAGHSLGGYVAARVAAADPHRFAALVLIGASADPAAHPLLVRTYTGFARLLPVVGPARMARLANGVIARLGADPHRLPGDTGYAVLPAAWADVVAQAGVHDVAGLPCPVWVVAGQFDQLGIDARAYAAAAPDGRRRIIPRASHLAPLTHRPQVAAVLREAVLHAS